MYKRKIISCLIIVCIILSLFSACSNKEETKAQHILNHKKDYPSELVNLVKRNPETADFVYNYQNLLDDGKNTEEYGKSLKLTNDDYENKDCLLLQWDERWGAIPYGKSMIALSGCGPTCMSMASFILTQKKKNTPAKVARYCMKHDYYVMNEGTSWELFDTGCKDFGLKSKRISVNKKKMKKALDKGGVIVASMAPGDFTSSGHFIVIDGYDGDDFYVKDPNSIERSKRLWTFDSLKDQIKGLWAMYKDK